MFGLNKLLVFVAVTALATQSAVGAMAKAKVGHTVHLIRDIGEMYWKEMGRCHHAPKEFRTHLSTTDTLCNVYKIGYHRDDKHNDSCHFGSSMQHSDISAAKRKTKEFGDACTKAGGRFEQIDTLDSEGKPQTVKVNLVLPSNPDKVVQVCDNAGRADIYPKFTLQTRMYEKVKDNHDGTLTCTARQHKLKKILKEFKHDCEGAGGHSRNP
ncbi:hypothetical protein ACQY0O_001741 [Thecaphora frezii]